MPARRLHAAAAGTRASVQSRVLPLLRGPSAAGARPPHLGHDDAAGRADVARGQLLLEEDLGAQVLQLLERLLRPGGVSTTHSTRVRGSLLLPAAALLRAGCSPGAPVLVLHCSINALGRHGGESRPPRAGVLLVWPRWGRGGLGSTLEAAPRGCALHAIRRRTTNQQERRDRGCVVPRVREQAGGCAGRCVAGSGECAFLKVCDAGSGIRARGLRRPATRQRVAPHRRHLTWTIRGAAEATRIRQHRQHHGTDSSSPCTAASAAAAGQRTAGERGREPAASVLPAGAAGAGNVVPWRHR